MTKLSFSLVQGYGQSLAWTWDDYLWCTGYVSRQSFAGCSANSTMTVHLEGLMTAQLAPRTPTRRTGWPVLRTPRWMLAGAAVLVVGLVLAALPHRPSTGQRAADLR